MAGKRTVKMVRAVGVTAHDQPADCKDPRSGAVVNQVVAQQYVAAAIARHAATHED